MAAQFLLFSLKPIRAICFMEKTYEQLLVFFSVGEKRRPAACRFSLEQKNKGLAIFYSGAENRDCWCGFSGAEKEAPWCVFLEQKTEAA